MNYLVILSNQTVQYQPKRNKKNKICLSMLYPWG